MDSTLLSILSTIITVAFLYFLVPDTSNAARRLRWIIALCDKLMTEATQWRFSDGAADILGLGNSNDVTCSLPESGERGADSGLKDAAISWKPPTLRTLGAGIQHLGLRDFLQQPRSKSPPGLGNLDNSCFQNSVIQSLASLPNFQLFLQQLALEVCSLPAGSTAVTLHGVLTALNDDYNCGKRLWIPSALKSMSTWQQQDAQEYFSKLLEKIDGDVALLRPKHSGLGQTERASVGQRSGDKVPAAQDENVARSKLAEVARSIGQFQEEATLGSPFDGFLAQRVGCLKCGYTEGLSLSSFSCLTLPLVDSVTCSLSDCMQEYAKLEVIEDVDCARCTLKHTEQQLQRALDKLTTDEVTDEATDEATGSEGRTILQTAYRERLAIVRQAIATNDLADDTVIGECRIAKKQWQKSLKSRQAVVMRAPEVLVLHINRSIFDEYTGDLRKNHSALSFPLVLDLAEFTLGSSTCRQIQNRQEAVDVETWPMNPSVSMLQGDGHGSTDSSSKYQLCAIITHVGRHENGHYVCYRRFLSTAEHPSSATELVADSEDRPGRDGAADASATWWRISDDDVAMVSEEAVLRRGSAFMLFYELMDLPGVPLASDAPAAPVVETTAATSTMAGPAGLGEGKAESMNGSAKPTDIHDSSVVSKTEQSEVERMLVSATDTSVGRDGAGETPSEQLSTAFMHAERANNTEQTYHLPPIVPAA